VAKGAMTAAMIRELRCLTIALPVCTRMVQLVHVDVIFAD